MSNNPAAPLLSGQEREESGDGWDDRTQIAPSRTSRAASQSSRKSGRSQPLDERTPLLSQGDTQDQAGQSLRDVEDEESPKKKSKARWPTLVGIAFLCSLAILILGLAFAAPEIVEEYSKEAVVFEPSNLSIESFTSSGVRARIRGDFVVDGSRVQKKSVRDLGRAGTWIAGAVETKPTVVKVYLPQYDNLLLGTADIPAITVSIRDGQVTPLDFVAEVSPGNFDGIRQIANDWLDGRLAKLQVVGKADVSLKSGIFSLGTQHLTQALKFEDDGVPELPTYEITKLLVHEIDVDGQKAMAADVAVKAFNKFPVTFNIPSMSFDVLVPGCPSDASHIVLANATTREIAIKPEQNVVARARGVVRELPKLLVGRCPGTDTSPLDTLLENYLHGSEATVYVRGSQEPHEGVPGWITDLLKDVEVPVPVPSKKFDGLIRNFTMADTHFSLPNPLAEPDTPEASPRVSAIIKVIANLPREMNFPVEISHIRASADVFYRHKKLGVLDLNEWQKANSTRIYPHGDVPSGLAVDAKIVDAPLRITNDDLFTEIIQAMLFGGEKINLDVKADVDVETHTALGRFVVKGIPAEGNVPIKQPGGKGGFDFKAIAPKIHSLEITDTTIDSISLSTLVNMTNPTNYSATVPFVDIRILVNNTVMGHATARNIDVTPGRNHNLRVDAVWNPVESAGSRGRHVARELLSQYISGYNTTLEFQTHQGSIPSLPGLGSALSNITLKIPTPRLNQPKNPHDGPGGDPDDPSDDKSSRFIQDATMHLFSSSADFVLLSPLKKNTIYLTHINATAYYNHTETVGFILYDVPFPVPPGESTTPRLPVEWDVLSVGYEAIREALGGTLKLDAEAEVSLKLEEWEQNVWFKGGGIGAHVRP